MGVSIPKMLAANPIFQQVNARQNFLAVAAIVLRDWGLLEQAEDWCKLRWKHYGRQYRLSTREEDCYAIFEFPDDDDTVEFLMRFG